MIFEAKQTTQKIAFIFLIGFLALVGPYFILGGQHQLFLMAIAGFSILICTVMFPVFPISVLYPAIWIFWPYYLSSVRGRPERIIGVLGILGFFLFLQQKKARVPAFPPLVSEGIFIFTSVYVLSWFVHGAAPSGTASLISLISRLLFFYLVFTLVQSPSDINTGLLLFIIGGILSGILILYVSYHIGFGFSRNYYKLIAANKLLGPLWSTVVSTSNFNTSAAVLLFSRFDFYKTTRARVLVIVAALFLLLTAFLGQYRREVLLSIPLILFMMIWKPGRMRKPAFVTLLVGVWIFFGAILPTPTMQMRLQETSLVMSGKETRIVNFRAGLKGFGMSPLIGHGPGSYESVAYRVMGSNFKSFEYHAYNVFIWIAVESGLLGLFSLFMILIGVYRESKVDLSKSSDTERWVLKAAPFLLILIFIWFTFGNSWENSIPWFFMGIILAASRMTKERVLNSVENTKNSPMTYSKSIV